MHSPSAASRLRALGTLTALTLAVSVAATGCGGGDESGGIPGPAPAPAPAPAAAPSPAPAPAPAPAPSPAAAPAAPTVSSLSPATGFMTGGSTITLTGSGFTGATAVSFGGTAATNVVVVNDTTLTVTSPVHSAGTVDISVTTPAGSTTAAGAFSYLTAGRIQTLAGGGSATTDDVPATTAVLRSPIDTVEDAAGNLLIAEYQGSRVRLVAKVSGTFWGQTMTAGNIYTIAGTGTSGTSGDAGPATAAGFSTITGVALDADGNLAIVDYQGSRLRLVAASTGTFYGIAMTAGNVYTVAGGGASVPDDVVGTAAQLNQPVSVTADQAGNLVLGGYTNNRVQLIASRDGTWWGRPMTAGRIYTLAGTGTAGFSGDSGPATAAAVNWPIAVAVDAAGHLLFSDFRNNRVRLIAASTGTAYGVAVTAGNIYTVAGDGTTTGSAANGADPLASPLPSPSGVGTDSAGNLLIALQGGSLRVLAAADQTRYGVVMTTGKLYTVGGGGTTLGDNGPATSASVQTPFGFRGLGSGEAVVSEFGNGGRVRTITP